jgi:hypothetical protein
MKTLWILAAAATFAACHSRSDEGVGAAPDRGDTTAVSGYDTTAAKPTAKVDTTAAAQPTAPSADTSAAAQPTAPSAGYDTTSTAVPPTTTDTTMAPPAGGAVDSASTQR